MKVPRTRDGNFSVDLFHRYQRSEQAFVIGLMEMFINGVSTRKVSQITEELCGTSFSKSTVSNLCKNLDPIIKGWNNRSLADHHFPFVIVDAMYMKVRENGRVRSRGVLIAVGVNTDGHREVLGFQVGDSESTATWSALFAWLKSRGLSSVDVITSDHHGGLVNAIRKEFQGATWQRCQTHFLRNIMDVTPKSLQSEIHGHVRSILHAPDHETARVLLDQTLDTYAQKANKAMKLLEEGLEDATAILSLPDHYRKRLRTTNSVERMNEEIRRRERVIRIFPNRESLERIVGALLMEIHEKWSSGKRYLDMQEYLQRRESDMATQPKSNIIKLV